MRNGKKPSNPVRAVLRELRHAPDRLLHRRRSRQAKQRLAALRSARSAVFICHGNINRSAYAAAAFMRATPSHIRDTIRVRSAGFVGPDRPASELALEVARRRGVDLSEHRSRLIDVDELRTTDLIVVMNTDQRAEICRLTGRPPEDILLLGDLDSRSILRRRMLDPYGHSVVVFEQVFDRIDRCIDELAGVLWGR